jgi:membrane-bound lytic murein transglycosylase D
MIRFIFLAFSVAILGGYSLHSKESKKYLLKEEETINIPTLETDLIAIDFCGEMIPLTEPLIAKRYQNMVQNYNNSTFHKMISKMEKQMKIIEPILKKYGVPDDFKYLPIIESEMNHEATSPKGAGGYWQIMPSTAEYLGLVINDQVDERRNLTKSTHAAAKYIKSLHKQLGSWTLVAAAFNAGPQHIQNKLNAQNKDDYFALKLNKETTNYVYKILAVKEWHSNPERSKLWGSHDVLHHVARIKDQVQNTPSETALLTKAISGS